MAGKRGHGGGGAANTLPGFVGRSDGVVAGAG